MEHDYLAQMTDNFQAGCLPDQKRKYSTEPVSQNVSWTSHGVQKGLYFITFNFMHFHHCEASSIRAFFISLVSIY